MLATGAFENSRTLGTVVAADLKLPAELRGKRVGFQVYQEAMKQGALLRNLGNTVYWLPPLNSAPAAIEQLAEITAKSVLSVRQKLGF